MINNKKNLALLIALGVVMAFVFYAFSVAPPEIQKDEHEGHDHEQPTILEGEISQIDQTSAKSIAIRLDEMTNEDCANQIANSLAKLGSIGKIKCDIEAKIFEVQYDPKKINESHILNAFAEAQHPGKIASNL